jgi:hypothetical protein
MLEDCNKMNEISRRDFMKTVAVGGAALGAANLVPRLGYSELAKSIKIPLVNLHTGEMSKVGIPDGFVYIRRSVCITP